MTDTETKSRNRTETTRENLGDKEREVRHPAFGIATLSRINGSPGVMFGSSLTNHSAAVELCIHRATRIEETAMHAAWNSAEEKLICVRFTPAQFAELITSFNVGGGAACTIDSIGGERMPRLTLEDVDILHKRVHQTAREQFRGQSKELRKWTDEIVSVVAEAGKKKLLERVRQLVSIVHSHLESNAPFALEQFDKAVTDVVTEAKAEIDATTVNAVLVAGAEALQQRAALAQAVVVPELPDGAPSTEDHSE